MTGDKREDGEGHLTLRDTFAAAAMQALATRTDHMCGVHEVATEAYQYADAMLKARQSTGG